MDQKVTYLSALKWVRMHSLCVSYVSLLLLVSFHSFLTNIILVEQKRVPSLYKNICSNLTTIFHQQYTRMDEWMKLKLKTNEEEEKLRNEKLTIELEVARLMKKVEEAKKDLKVAEDRGVEAGKAVEQAAKEFKSETHVDPCDAVAVTPPSSDSASPREAAAETFVTISKRKRKFVVSRGSTSEKLGLFFSNNTTEITRVYPGFAAARAKLQTGMIIREINGNVTNTLKEVDNFLRDGSWLELRLLVEEDFTEADATEEEEEYIIVPAQASETTLPDNGDPRSPVESMFR